MKPAITFSELPPGRTPILSFDSHRTLLLSAISGSGGLLLPLLPRALVFPLQTLKSERVAASWLQTSPQSVVFAGWMERSASCGGS